MTWTAVTTLSSAFLSGLLLALPANAAGPLSAHLGLTDAAARRLRFLFLLALIPLLLVVGQVIDKWEGGDVLHEALILGLLLAATGLTMLGVRRDPRTALTATLLLAAATACLLPSATLLMPRVLPFRGDVQKTNFGYVFFGAGLLLAAPLLEHLRAGVNFRRGMLFFALLAILASAAAILAPREQVPAPRAFESARFFSDIRVLFAVVTMLLYFPLEASLRRWSEKCLGELGYTPRRVAWLLLFFALVFLVARLVTALFLPRYEDVLLLVLVLVAAGVFGNLSGVGPSSGAKGLLLMWAACGPVFPTLLGVVLPRAPGEATTFAALFAVGVFGCALTYPVMRKVADSHVVRGTLSIPMVLGTLLVSATVVLVLLY